MNVFISFCNALSKLNIFIIWLVCNKDDATNLYLFMVLSFKHSCLNSKHLKSIWFLNGLDLNWNWMNPTRVDPNPTIKEGRIRVYFFTLNSSWPDSIQSEHDQPDPTDTPTDNLSLGNCSLQNTHTNNKMGKVMGIYSPTKYPH